MSRPSKGRLRLSGGFLLLTAWFWLCNGGEMLAIIFISAALHECGHLLALYAVGGRLIRMRVNALGAVMETDSRRLGYRQELLVVLAGPAVNLAAAAGSASWLGERAALFAGVNLVLCLFNLLPIAPLDGGQGLYLAVCWAADPMAGEWVVRCVGTACASAAAGGLIWLMVRSGGSLWLLPVTGGLFGAIWRLWSGKSLYFLK